MARDYKHTKTKSSGSVSAWGGFTIGLLIGLVVATAVYIYDRRPGANVTANGAPLSNEKDNNSSSAPTPDSAQSGDSGTEFEFYDMLPKQEVEVARDAAKAKPASGSSAAGAIDTPGSYVLQVGSYRNYADADRVRAKLAIQGIESSVQKISIDNDVWHRVRIGPINNLNKLEDTRRKLREAQIDALVIKQGKSP